MDPLTKVLGPGYLVILSHLKSHWNQVGIRPQVQRREILGDGNGRKIETSDTINNNGIKDTLDDKTTTNEEIHPETWGMKYGIEGYRRPLRGQ